MNPDIRKLYLFHLFNGIAISVFGNWVFLDQLLLRMGLDMRQFGLIKGVALLVSLGIGLLVSPWITSLGADRRVIAIAYLARVTVPFLLLCVPLWTRDRDTITLAYAGILTVTMIFPTIAQNCLQVVFRDTIPSTELGRSVGRITMVWSVVSYVVVIPLGWYLDRHMSGTEEEFLSAFFVISLATTVMQVPASWFIWRLSAPKTAAQTSWHWGEIFEPFRKIDFRALLSVIAALSALGAMVEAFINPCLITVYKLTTYHITIIDAVVVGAGLFIVPAWGNLTDRFGGRNVLRVGVLGVGAGLLCLAGHGPVFLVVFTVLAWRGSSGVFGFAMSISRQILTIAMGDPSKTNIYVAAAGCVVGAGYFVGSIVGGHVLDWLATRMRPELPHEHFRIYFVFCGAAFLLVAQLISALRDRRPQLSPVEMAVAIWRTMRARFGRV